MTRWFSDIIEQDFFPCYVVCRKHSKQRLLTCDKTERIFQCVLLSGALRTTLNKSLICARLSMDWFLYDNGLRHERVKIRFNSNHSQKYETNSSFHVKQCNTVKLQFLFFSSFLLVSKKLLAQGEDLSLGYNL